MSQFFAFEADFVESLRCIPMQVRLKLDTCGIKLKLPQWHQFTASDRALLVELPCHTPAEVATYRTTLQTLVRDRTQQEASELAIDPAPEWLNSAQVPESVQTKAASVGVAIAPSDWARLAPEQRFALIKLSRSNHENHNFLPAAIEFKLADS